MKVFKVNSEQKAILKRCAQIEAASGGSRISLGNISLEPGIRMNIEDETRKPNMNLRLVTDDLNWDDTDLYDYGRWTDFCKGVELNADGDGEVDFYIRKVRYPDGDDSLFGNIQIIIEGGEMTRVDSTGGIRWTKTGGYV